MTLFILKSIWQALRNLPWELYAAILLIFLLLVENLWAYHAG